MFVEKAHAQQPAFKGGSVSHYVPGPSFDQVACGQDTIRRGHRGEDVRALQRALNAAGAEPPLAEDGLFGPKTQAALRGFQGAGASGEVDGGTLDRLRPYLGGAPEPADEFGTSRGPAGRAPHVGQRAPDGTVRAGGLQQADDARRATRRRGEPRPAGWCEPNRPNVPAPNLPGGAFDGRTPAPSTTSTRASAHVSPPLTNSEAEGRSGNTYAQVINQFAVGDNPRYARRNGNTYCNIFAWDVTSAMGAEIPHWIRHDGTPAQPFERGAYELNANATARWLNRHGGEHGWRRVSADEAQRMANEGHPAVAIRENPGGIGHVAVVRPGELTDRGPAIAQAGARNFNEGHARDVWRAHEPEYWVHA